MLTRRSVITGTSVLCLAAAASPRMASAGSVVKIRADFEVPRGACDAHVHVIGDPKEFPMARDRDYTPPAATAEDLVEALNFLQIDRVVIVTPTIYDSDNSVTLAAIQKIGRDRARGIAIVDDMATPDAYSAMAKAGIAGMRLFLANPNTFNQAHAAKRLKAAIELAKALGWHLQISTPPEVIAALQSQLAASPVPLVLDYFGWLAGGLDQDGFDAIHSLVESGRAYVKFAEAYRLSKQPPDYSDLVPVVDALVKANPDRLLWGSGWPNVSGGEPGRAKTDLAPNLPVDVGHLLNLLADWVPDPEIRHKILVDNPARLYGF